MLFWPEAPAASRPDHSRVYPRFSNVSRLHVAKNKADVSFFQGTYAIGIEDVGPRVWPVGACEGRGGEEIAWGGTGMACDDVEAGRSQVWTLQGVGIVPLVASHGMDVPCRGFGTYRKVEWDPVQFKSIFVLHGMYVMLTIL